MIKTRNIADKHFLKAISDHFGLFQFIVVFFMFIPLFMSCNSDGMEVETYGENSMISPNESVGGQIGGDANTDLKESITAILLDNGYTEFVQALDYVNAEIYTQLVELFSSQQEKHTVFAPSNEAFFKLYDCLGMQTQDISELGDPGLVRDILLYHVAKGINDSNSIIPDENELELETLYGKALVIKSDRSIESIGSVAQIDPNGADKKAKNGVVHVISEVLLPVELSCQ